MTCFVAYLIRIVEKEQKGMNKKNRTNSIWKCRIALHTQAQTPTHTSAHREGQTGHSLTQTLRDTQASHIDTRIQRHIHTATQTHDERRTVVTYILSYKDAYKSDRHTLRDIQTSDTHIQIKKNTHTYTQWQRYRDIIYTHSDTKTQTQTHAQRHTEIINTHTDTKTYRSAKRYTLRNTQTSHTHTQIQRHIHTVTKIQIRIERQAGIPYTHSNSKTHAHNNTSSETHRFPIHTIRYKKHI